MSFGEELKELEQRKEKAREMGGAARVGRRHEQGKLTAREWIEALLDGDTFLELGLLACSDRPGMEETTPADGIITGYGRIGGKHVGIIANDFTVLASSNARIYSKKAEKLRRQSSELGFPLIWLGESGGGRVPDIQGARGIVSLICGDDRSVFSQYSHIRNTPWITAVMGQCTGVPTWQCCLSDFVVQVKGSTLSVAGARALQKAIGATYT
ncbi:MAG: carboxyl transferase, partial [Deltaproteobacteria bacterium]|nr:carboxyl transferase [Deltaproteobacteria bacterium]